MLVLFYNLYLAMFRGTWIQYTGTEMWDHLKVPMNCLSQLITSIFGDNTYTTFGTDMANNWTYIYSFVLATITSIGIVVMAVKGVKKAFGIFFGQIR